MHVCDIAMSNVHGHNTYVTSMYNALRTNYIMYACVCVCVRVYVCICVFVCVCLQLGQYKEESHTLYLHS